jgi:hypothetical protein
VLAAPISGGRLLPIEAKVIVNGGLMAKSGRREREERDMPAYRQSVIPKSPAWLNPLDRGAGNGLRKLGRGEVAAPEAADE